MTRWKINYKQGDWFAVPLRREGYALGLVARADKRGRVLGYFFGPRLPAVPTLEDAKNLRPEDADYVGRFGDLNLVNGKWPILGSLDHWSPEEWPMPDFARQDIISGKFRRIIYSEQDLHEIREIPSEPEDVAGLPKDGLSGAGAIEIILTKLLSQ